MSTTPRGPSPAILVCPFDLGSTGAGTGPAEEMKGIMRDLTASRSYIISLVSTPVREEHADLG